MHQGKDGPRQRPAGGTTCRRAVAAVGVLAAGAALVALPAGPAGAHGVSQGDDTAIHSYDATWFEVCDNEEDGHSVWAGYYRVGSNTYYTAEVYYLPGRPPGPECSEFLLANPLSNIRVVEDNPNSSTNYYGAWHGYPVVGT